MTKVSRMIGAAAALAGVVVLLPAPASAWWDRGYWRGGPYVGFGIGIVPPIYAPPPVVYAPPPVYYAPPPVYVSPAPAPAAAPAGQACYAAGYTCPLDPPGPAGAPCSCPSNTGRRAYGHSG